MAETPDPRATPLPAAGQPETVDLPGGPARAAGATDAGRTTQPAAAAPDVITGAFGDYELLGEVERGGMGVVYRARERHSGLLVALKMMLPSGDAVGERQRFVLEARATGELNHPGIVAIHAWGEHQGHPFYTMDFVPGVTLSRVLEGGPLPCERAVRYFLGMAHAVGAAHSLGIVHRDLKPGNVIIDLSDQPRVLDFGLAKRLRQGRAPAEEAVLDVLPADSPMPESAVLARHTEKGAILGTPSYMAPEQVRAEHDRVGPPADVHALGAIFYEMVTGRPPFQGEGTYETLLQVLHRPPDPLRARAPGVPAGIEECCRRCLEKESHKRYPTATALAEDLERRWQRAEHGSRFGRLALGAGLVLLVLALLGFLFGGLLAPLHPERLLDRLGAGAPASEPVRRAAGGLAALLALVVLVLAPYLAEVGLVVWLGAWVWNAERPWRIVGGCAAAAAAVLALSNWPGLEALHDGPLFLGWLLLANTLAVLGVLLYRARSARERTRAETHRPADPYLQKLFAVRMEARPRSAARQRAPQALGLGDFELGKTLHRWDDHEVRWARQKSLDRATLVWLDRASPRAGVVPGVVVRHPAVLGLHAVGTTPEGSYLVTDPVAASPLSEVLGQRGPVPLEAAALTAQLARAVQAFHDQGACHGRLSPEWVLVRGELEPVLCPCGFPSQSAEHRMGDVRALGGLLRSWLPPRLRGVRRHLLAPLCRVVEAAEAGGYARAADLADDLERAVRQVRLRWRESWAHALALGFLAGPLWLPAVVWLLTLVGVLDRQEFLPGTPGATAGYLLLLLLPSAGLLGYTQVRGLIHRWQEWGRAPGSPAGRGRLRDGLWLPLAEVVLLTGVAGVLAWCNLPATGSVGTAALGLLLVAGEFTGSWFLGASLASLVTFLELLFRSLHAIQPGRGGGSG
jgi:serine/threonine protein kinase